MRCIPIILFSTSFNIAFCQWVQQPDFPGNARDDASVLMRVSPDLSFVGTGRDAGFNLTNDWYSVQILSASANWNPIAALPASPRQYCTPLGEGTTLLFGGQDANGGLSELWEYGPASDTWFQRTSLPDSGRSACAGFYNSGFAYVIGGIFNDGSVSNEVWKYDYTLDSWTQLSDFPGTARHRAMYCDIGIVAGGADSLFNPLNDVWRFDFQNETWSQLASMPLPLYGASAASVYPNMILAGGVTSGDLYQAGVWRYDLTNNSWTSYLSPIPNARKGSAMIINSAWIPIIQIGLGIDSSNTRYNDWWWHDHTLGVPSGSQDDWEVYPIPSTDLVTISPNDNTSSYEVSLVDIRGRSVHNSNHTGKTDIDIRELAKGIYLLRIQYQGAMFTTRRLVVE